MICAVAYARNRMNRREHHPATDSAEDADRRTARIKCANDCRERATEHVALECEGNDPGTLGDYAAGCGEQVRRSDAQDLCNDLEGIHRFRPLRPAVGLARPRIRI